MACSHVTHDVTAFGFTSPSHPVPLSCNLAKTPKVKMKSCRLRLSSITQRPCSLLQH